MSGFLKKDKVALLYLKISSRIQLFSNTANTANTHTSTTSEYTWDTYDGLEYTIRVSFYLFPIKYKRREGLFPPLKQSWDIFGIFNVWWGW